MHYRPQPAGFLTLVVEGPQAALAFERAFPTQFEKCRQAKLIQELGSSHTSLFPYRMALEEYPWVVNHELSEFMRRFVPASSRDSHWFYDVSDLDSFDYDNEEELSTDGPESSGHWRDEHVRRSETAEHSAPNTGEDANIAIDNKHSTRA
jgi:hypothetical protein